MNEETIEQILKEGVETGDMIVIGQNDLGEDIYALTEQGRLKAIENQECDPRAESV